MDYNDGYIKGYKDAQKEFEKYYGEVIEVLDRFKSLIPKKHNLKIEQKSMFESQEFTNFKTFIKDRCFNIYKHFPMMEEGEFMHLRSKYGGKRLQEACLSLDNYNKINKYKVLHTTLNNWCK